MKKCILTLLATLLCLFLFARDITSTESGGDRRWGTPATWFGGIGPGANDNVFINGTVLVTGNSCNNLTVNSSGVLENNYSCYSLNVYGNVFNAGTIGNVGGCGLTCHFSGDIVNSGIMSPSGFNMNGSSNQNITNTGTMNPANFINTNPSFPITLLSNLVLSNVNADLWGGLLILSSDAGSYNLSMSAGNLIRAVIQGGNGATLSLSDGCYLANVSGNEIVFAGTVVVRDGVAFDTLINQGTIYNDYSCYSLNVYGNLFNAGTIRNSPPGGLTCHFSGDIVNSGIMSPSWLNMNGSSNQNITNTGTMNPDNFINTNPSFPITLLSNLVLSNVQADLRGGLLILSSDAGSYNLSMSAGNLMRAVIQGGNGATLSLSDGCNLANVSGNEIVFAGTVVVRDGVSFDTLINQGTINNWWSNYTLTVSQRLENHGAISNLGDGYLMIRLAGDLLDYGTINNYGIYLRNTEQRFLYQDPAAPPISCANFNSEAASSNHQLLSDLRFSGTTVNLSQHTLKLYNGRSTYGITMSGGRLQNAVLETSGFSFLNFSNGTVLQNVQAGDMILQGTITCADNCSFDDVINQAIVGNNYSNYTMIWNGNVVNYGTIQNFGGYLMLSCGKDLSNYGTIQNFRVSINGSQNQYILNAGTINAENFKLISEIGAAAWNFNGNPQGNGTEITINPANPGVWQPISGSLMGRLITIGSGDATLATPQNLSSYLSGNELKLRWNQVPGATYYNVYYSDLPEGPFDTLLGQVFDHDLSDGFVRADISGIEPHRFYQVRAGN